MVIKYTSHFLHKLEDLFAESDYMLRYEKGNFKSGYCVLKDTKMVLVNANYKNGLWLSAIIQEIIDNWCSILK